jgi:hypothetical protein
VAVLATARDQETAAAWQETLTAEGIMSVLHGHREDDGDDGSFNGVDVLVPPSALRRAREILGPEVTGGGDEGQPFPWFWLALGPALFFAAVALIAALIFL